MIIYKFHTVAYLIFHQTRKKWRWRRRGIDQYLQGPGESGNSKLGSLHWQICSRKVGAHYIYIYWLQSNAFFSSRKNSLTNAERQSQLTINKQVEGFVYHEQYNHIDLVQVGVKDADSKIPQTMFLSFTSILATISGLFGWLHPLQIIRLLRNLLTAMEGNMTTPTLK